MESPRACATRAEPDTALARYGILRSAPVHMILVIVGWTGPSVAAPTSAGLQSVAPLVVEAPPSVAAAAAGLQTIDPVRIRALMQLAGTTDARPITLIVAPEDSSLARAAPAWVAAYAQGDDRI